MKMDELKTKILEFLKADEYKMFSAKEIAEAVGQSRAWATQALKELVIERSIILKRVKVDPDGNPVELAYNKGRNVTYYGVARQDGNEDAPDAENIEQPKEEVSTRI